MKVECINNKGEFLKAFDNRLPGKDELNRFGSTKHTIYGELEVGKIYLVMGIIIFDTYQGYLIDNNGFISICPCQLFKVLDDKVPSDWHFRLVDKEETIYPFVQAIFGYFELSSDKNTYENLIVEKEEDAERIYFRRKIEMEKKQPDCCRDKV